MSLTRFPVLPIFLLFLFLVTAHTVARAKTIHLEVQPSLEQLRPLNKPASLTLTLRNDTGKVIDGSRFQIRLYAPPRGLLFSTDFPQVEGTPLIEIKARSLQGKLEWEYVFPIRGMYLLEVTAVNGAGDEVKQVFPLRIRESRTKLVILGIFLTVLFLFGLLVGRLFTPRSTEAHIGGSILWLVGAMLSVSPATAQTPTMKVRSDLDLRLRLEVSPPKVGQLSDIQSRLFEEKTGKSHSTHLKVAITQLEKGKRIFFLGQIPTDGNFAFKFQFFDGSPHKVSGVAELKGMDPIRAEKVVAVMGVEPPKAISLRALVLFLLVLVFGLIIGRMSRRRRYQ